MIKISPSILAADFLELGADLKRTEDAGADFHHVDVMDGHYVPNLTIGPPVVSAIKKNSGIPLDVHIMVSNSDAVYKSYLDSGADFLTFHPETAKDPRAILRSIRDRGRKAGIALNPDVDFMRWHELYQHTDLVLVMSVFPGFGGQAFIETAVPKVRNLSTYLQKENLAKQVTISVDGGINQQTGALVRDAGANFLVAGSYVYNAKDRKAAIASLRAGA